MEVATLDEAIYFENSDQCTGHSYQFKNKEMDLAHIKVTGRYPSKGFAFNKECKEMVYVLSGRGKVFSGGKEAEIKATDLIYIPENEKYYWEGELDILITCNPPFHPDQHECEEG